MPPLPEPLNPPGEPFAVPPDPGQAATLDDLVEKLRQLKVWAGDPSYERITDRINAVWKAAGRPAGEMARKTTVADCFRPGRRRLNSDLVAAIVQALHLDVGYATQWRQALRVIGGETEAASQVRVQDTLPPDLAAFTGRTIELDQLLDVLHHGQGVDRTAVISAIAGMAGVGKTQLAIRIAHMLAAEKAFDRVLFVNLRGFHPDPAQPPADPAAVLDGFLRLLGVPGQQIPHDPPARAAAYRHRLANTRTLVVLDNAADEKQVRPLLATTPGCLTLVTSRRDFSGLQPAVHLTVDVFTAEEASTFLRRAVPGVPIGTDPRAVARIAQRCGHLPFALGLAAGHIRNKPGWTLTDHADRLDERHRHRQLDTSVELALDLSYQHLPTDQQRLLRLVALHPGQDLDARAAAALADTDLPTVQDLLHRLCRDHLLQQAIADRYSFHDLVRAYATSRASDQDPPRQRRAALTRIFDYYVSTTATAMDLAYPYERKRPPAGATPGLSDRSAAEHWLDTELTNLLAAAQHAAEHGWPEHLWQLSAILDRHLHTRGHFREAETLHQHSLNLARRLGNSEAKMSALQGLGQVDRSLGRYEQASDRYQRALRIAQDIGDRVGERHALIGLGTVHRVQGRFEQATTHYGWALQIAQDTEDRSGELTALTGLGDIHQMLGRYEQAGDYYERALRMAQDAGDRVGQRQALTGLGGIHRLLGRYEQAADHFGWALQIAQDLGDRVGELQALSGLGLVHRLLGRYEQAADHFGSALRIAQDTGHRLGELNALIGLGQIHQIAGRHRQAMDRYQQVLSLARELGNRNWQFEALQGMGRLHQAAGHPDLALTHHQQALQHATDLTQPADQARAHDGLAHAHHALNDHDRARQHWRRALEILTGLGTDHTEETSANIPSIRAHLRNLDAADPCRS